MHCTTNTRLKICYMYWYCEEFQWKRKEQLAKMEGIEGSVLWLKFDKIQMVLGTWH